MSAGLVLVGCCGPKLAIRAPAKDLYQSQLFRLARAWAEEHGDSWAVLSALHGVVLPETELDPYDFELGRVDADARAEWARRSVFRLTRLGVAGEPLTILAGNAYAAPIRKEFVRLYSGFRPSEIVEPLAGLGIGARKAWLAARTSTPTAWVTA